jgi:hypothetical protein
MQLSKYQQDELDHLVEMAKEDKREAWHAALERAKSPLLADMPRLLTERMNALKQPKEAATVDLSTAEWDREQLEKAEARTLAHSYQGADVFAKHKPRLERIYGKGAYERIKAHMETILKEELLKC